MPDPLLCDYPLPLRVRVYPLGFPVDVFTNSQQVVDAAIESWAEFTQTFDRPAAVLRFGVTESEDAMVPPAPVYRGHRNLISIVSGPDNFAVCDVGKAMAFGWVTSAVVADPAFFRYFFLEACAYLLIDAANLAGVHAACVEWRGRGVLLSGTSGAGKSTLAYACARSGWKYICDDASFLVRDGEPLMVTGNPHQIRLRESAVDLFPELNGLPSSSRPNGKMTLEVRTATLPNFKIGCHSKVHVALFLNRTLTDAPELVPYSKAAALEQWADAICYGDEDIRKATRKTMENLLSIDMYEFRYSDAAAAVSYLEAFLDGEN